MSYLPALALNARGNVLPKFVDQGFRDIGKAHRFGRRGDGAEFLFQIDRFDFLGSFGGSSLLSDG